MHVDLDLDLLPHTFIYMYMLAKIMYTIAKCIPAKSTHRCPGVYLLSVAPSITETLETNDLKLIYGALFEVRARWQPIGLELRLTPGTLEEIEQVKINPSDRLMAVLLNWLRGTTATWKLLIVALQSAPVGATQLARKLELKYCSPGK